MPLLDQSLVDSVIKRALRSGADFVELFVERKRNQSISLEESKVQRVSSGNDLGAGLRIIHQGTVSYVYTEDLSEDGLLKTADLAAQVGRRGGGRFAFGELVGAPRQPQRIEVAPDTIGPAAKIELLLEADQAARAVSGAIKQVAVGYGQSAQEVLVATSEGTRHTDSRTRVRLMVHAVAERNGEIQTAMEAPGMQRGFEFFDETSAAEYARAAAERAVALLDAAPSPAGPMAVVVGNEFGGLRRQGIDGLRRQDRPGGRQPDRHRDRRWHDAQPLGHARRRRRGRADAPQRVDPGRHPGQLHV
jgi:TldD protein